MSGVLALLSLDGRPVPQSVARAQLEAIRYRGEGEPVLWLGEGVALGQAHRPTTPAAEREVLPLLDESGRYRLVWDGRIDNRDELASALEWRGARAREASDADYVLAAYVRWGDACVTRLIGDWAIVIWDAAARRLFCAKDAIGSRPLFFSTVDGLLAVVTEPEQIFAAGLLAPEPNGEFVLRHIADALQEPNACWYAGVSQLEGGQTLIASGSTVTVDRYWTVPRAQQIEARDPSEYVDAFEALFAKVVAAQLRTNGPLGIYLSGGIDSSYVAAVATKQGARPLAMTYFVEGMQRFDEREYARTVASALDLELLELDASDCWSYSSRWLDDAAFDIPHHPPQGAGQRMLAVTASHRGIRTVLDGLGGDEHFNGREAYLAETLASGHPWRAYQLAARSPSGRAPLGLLARSAYEYCAPRGLRTGLLRMRSKHGEMRPWPTVVVDPRWRSVFALADEPRAWQAELYRSNWWTVWRQFVAAEQNWRDRREAELGLDRRSPLFDLRIVEFAASIPPWVLRFQGRRKDILRAAVARVLPAKIADRQDWGLYDELLLEGIRNREARRVEDGLERVLEFPGVNVERARSEVEGIITRGHRFFSPSVNLVSTGLWLRYVDALRPSLATAGGLTSAAV